MNNRQRGFSLVELLIVVAIAGILAAIAFPSFMDWRRNMEYRAAARDIVSVLRDARSRAISRNLEHRVEFVVASRQYKMTRGNLAANSTSWTDVRDFVTLPTGVNMTVVGGPNMEFNPNGTSGSGSVAIKDSNNIPRFTITVASTGRVRISQ